MSFRAVVIDQKTDAGRILEHTAQLRSLGLDALMPGDVLIEVAYSGVNFKDALAIAGRPGVVRAPRLIPGVDLVGTVTSSEDPRWHAGDEVILTGDGLGETHHGGLAERARVRGDALVRRPRNISMRQAAAIGTAGFTAMLSVLALERGGVEPDAGDVVVTGAAGGVGSVAVAVLAKLGYRVTASSGRAQEQGDYLRGLGAASVIDRAELGEPGPPLQRRRWAGAIDSLGSVTLANLLAQTSDGGTVTACGLAQGSDLPATVMPFILRAVTLAGINSVTAPIELREEAWSRLADDLDLGLLDGMTEVIGLPDVFARSEKLLAGGVRGRTAVEVRR